MNQISHIEELELNQRREITNTFDFDKKDILYEKANFRSVPIYSTSSNGPPIIGYRGASDAIHSHVICPICNKKIYV